MRGSKSQKNIRFKAIGVCAITVLTFMTGVNGAPVRTVPTQTDMDGLTWLNIARTNPKSLIPYLQAILCKEFNPVPSPGPAYDVANGICSIFSTGIYPIIAQILG